MKFSIATLMILASAVSAQRHVTAESNEWYQCVDTLLNGFDVGQTGTAAGCRYWTCVENVATKYNRGGALAAIGNVASTACLGSGFVPVCHMFFKTTLGSYF
jgi:hypothetical protein